MIAFFRKLRRQSLTAERIGKYLLYAAGEILLIMVGILLALQINNRNETQQAAERYRKTLQVVRQDLVRDSLRAADILSIYEDEDLQDKFVRVMQGEVTAADYDSIPKLSTLITVIYEIQLNDNGYRLLASQTPPVGDTLSQRLTELYTVDYPDVRTAAGLLLADGNTNFDFWKRNTSTLISLADPTYQEATYNYYLNGTDYRSRVVYHFILLYQNYLPNLNYVLEEIRELLPLLPEE